MFYIEEVKLNNFRQYRSSNRSTVRFVLDKEQKRNANIVEGTNGYGKSNFLSALLWCFYGDEGKDPGEQFFLLNRLTADSLNDGDQAEVGVEICINSDGERYSVKRTQNFKKNLNDIIPVPTGDSKARTKFEIFALDQTNAHCEENPESFINILMPQQMREYFFFDGEKLEKYFDSTGHKRIKDAVFNVSQLSVVDKIAQKAQGLENKLKRELNKMPGASKDIAKELDEATTKISSLENEISELKNNKTKLEYKYHEIFDQYERVGGDVANQLNQERREIVERIEFTKEKIKEIKNGLSQELTTHAPTIIGIDIIKSAQRLFKKAVEDKLIPPNVLPSFIDTLIVDGQCMCGSKLSGDDEAQRRLEALNDLKIAIPTISAHAQSALQVSASLEEININLLTSKIKVEKLFEESENLIKTLKSLRERKEKIELQVSDNAEHIGISDIKEKITNITDQIAITSQKIGKITEELERQRGIESELSRKQQKLTASSTEAALLQRRIDSTQNLILIAQNIQRKIMEETRSEISTNTKQFFTKMLEGLDNVSEIEIEINQDYELTCEVNGKDMIPSFAAGQKSALAVSFLMALNKFTGFETPIVFDSVLGRIGDNMRKNFARIVPEVLSSKQLIFLFLDSEFDSNVRSEISPALGALYKIKRKNSDEQFVTESELIKQV